MLEAEPGCGYAILVIKDNVKGVLFTTDAITLTTLTFYLNFDECGHLVIKTHHSCRITLASFLPYLIWFNEILEGSDPRVHWGNNGIIERS